MSVDYYSYNHNQHKLEEEDEDDDEFDDYIDMEVSSFPFSPPPKNPREFEFSSINLERDAPTSPADELFYMGKLLPLHLPPRLQLVEQILHDSTSNKFDSDQFYSTPLGTDCAVTPVTSTPFESCQVSRELNPDEYVRVVENGDGHKEFNGGNSHIRKSWTKKLKSKIKSLFGKNSGIEIYSAAVKKTEEQEENSCAQISLEARFDKKNDSKDSKFWHRRSFSGALRRRYSTTKVVSSSFSSSSSSSFSSSSSLRDSSNSDDYPSFKRNISADSDLEASLIQGAIAHCKQSSQHAVEDRKTK